jgi:hypothetical protein
MSRQPIDNRDLRILDLNINESLNNIADSISSSISEATKDTTNLLEEINRNLGDIASELSALIDIYQGK